MNTQEYFTHEGSEEGEIVDSDEEQTMRKRMEELEAKNDELEKIATIANQFKFMSGRSIILSRSDVARIPSDASSISSDEFEPIPKHSGRKEKSIKRDFHRKHRSKTSSHHSRSNQRSSENISKSKKQEDIMKKRKRTPLRKSSSVELVNENFLETISLDSDEDSCRNTRDNSSSELDEVTNSLHLNREELRMAVAHENTAIKSNRNRLRDRLCNGNVLLERKENTMEDAELKQLNVKNKLLDLTANDSSPESKEEITTQEEQELRLIALRSAVLNKHWARKKRNAEIPYSPTDFKPEIDNRVIIDDNMDVVDEGINQLDDIMEISPIGSPKLILSPKNDEKTGDESNWIEDNKSSVDMDIAVSDSSDENDGIIYDKDIKQNWCPIEIPPMSTTTYSPENNASLKYPLPTHFGIYIPEMPFHISNSINPATAFANLIDFDEEPPPPPPFNLNLNSKSLSPKVNHIDDDIIENEHFEQNMNSSSLEENDDKESDEEASALRAVLLSKFQANKNVRKNLVIEKKIEETCQLNSEVSTLDNDAIKKSRAESVLQKALRRLKSSFSTKGNNSSKFKRIKSEDLIDERQEIVENNSNCSTDSSELSSNEFKRKLKKTPIIKKLMNLRFDETSKLKKSSHDVDERSSQSLDSITPNGLQNENASTANEDVQITAKKIITNEIDTKATNDISNKVQENIHHPTEEIITQSPKKNSNETINHVTNCKEIENKLPNASVVNTSPLNLRNTTSILKTTPKNGQNLTQTLSAKNTLTFKNKTINIPIKSSQTLLDATVKKVRTTKIVRPNKVINKNVTTSMKRAITEVGTSSPPPTKIQRQILSTKSNNLKENMSEKIVPKMPVKRLVIQLRASDTETSDEDLLNELQSSANSSSHSKQSKRIDTYNDIASPLELLMNSSSSSPFRNKCTLSNDTAIDTNQIEIPTAKSNVNNGFEKKLDSFLKDMRSKGSQNIQSKKVKNSPIKYMSNEKAKSNSTSVGTPSVSIIFKLKSFMFLF